MGSFSLKKGAINKVSKNIIAFSTVVDRNMKKRMEAATTIIWATAHAKRPKISAAEHAAMGRTKGGYRVSDPNAVLGVPVDTGALQASIKKNVTQKGGKTIGTVTAGGGLEYAPMIEFGTSRMAARPFMRPAINENAGKVKAIFSQKIDKL